jgi:ketosteroid isomerase-like protein
MKRLANFSLLMSGLIFSTITLADKGNTMNTEENKVLGTITQMGSNYNSQDIDAVMKAYEASAVVLFEPGNPVSGSAAIKAAFQGSLAVNPHFVFGKHEVTIAGDIALHLTPWTMTGKTPDGHSISQSGLSVAVLRKQADGEWLMVIDNPHGQALLVMRDTTK